MRVCFWGTRGSLAKPGPTTLRYGGNTSCVEVRTADGTLIVFVGDTIGSSDLFVVKRDGSGLRNISNSPDFESSPSWSRLP